MAIRRKHVRALVESLLDQFKIRKASVDVHDLAQKMGIEVRIEAVDNDLSGFLFRDAQSNKAIIGVNDSHHENRQRFTIAHEIGHYLLHAGEPVHVDGANVAFRLNHRDAMSSTGSDDSEREANLFAAELLMPARFLEKDLKSRDIDLLDDKLVRELAEQYKVSTQALTFRLANLGYVNLNA